jgi:methylmalonyl-CoA/ethylmalonyl-CoA epimerase
MDSTGMSAPLASIALSWAPQGTFHHVGFVVASIQNSVKGFAETLEAEWDGVITHDPNQAVRVAFLRSKSASDPLFELVEPAGEKSPVIPFLKKGGGLHHLCYEVADLEKQLELSRSKGGLITRAPMPAEAFGGRRIAWVYTRSKLLIEYLERAKV